MNTSKMKNAMQAYTGFKGDVTVAAVMDGIPEELTASLTGKQIGLIMNAVNAAYHRGRASTGAEMIDINCVFIEKLGRSIEWNEVGAEYEVETVIDEGIDKDGMHYKVTTLHSKKVKDGELIPSFYKY